MKPHDDFSQRKRFDSETAESDRFLQENHDQQRATQDRIRDLLSEARRAQGDLAELAKGRQQEVERRMALREKEEARRNGHAEFLSSAESYIANLEATIANSERVKDISKALNDFILDGCDNIALKFDRTETLLNEMAMRVNRQYLKQFTDYYLATGRLLHRKTKKMELVNAAIANDHVRLELALDAIDPLAKKHACNKQEHIRVKQVLDEEIEALRAKLRGSSRSFEAVGASLKELGIPFVHPDVILQKSSEQRNLRVLNYRDLANVTQQKIDTSLEAEAHAISRAKDALTQKLHESERSYHQKTLAPRPPVALTGSEGDPNPNSFVSKSNARDSRTLAKYQAASYQQYRKMCDT
eukprot:gene14182-21731_t